MKVNKKLFALFALNAMAALPGEASERKTEKLYNGIVKNFQAGKSNRDNYKLIEKILKQRNKELKDLYLQGDYVVKPEYLEWQIFFSGFYNNIDRGGSKEFVSTITEMDPKTINLGMVIPIRGLARENISLDLTSPFEPEINISIPSVNVILPEAVDYVPISVAVYNNTGMSAAVPNKNSGQNSVETGEETNIIAYNTSGSKMFENLNIDSAGGTEVKWDSPTSLTMTGQVNYSNTGLTGVTNASESHTGQGSSISVLNIGVDGDFTIKGDWSLRANSTQNSTFAFLSYMPNYITQDSSVVHEGTLGLSRGAGSRGILVGLSLNLINSTASGLPTATLENKGEITLNMNPSTALGRVVGMQLDPIYSKPLIKGELINSGKITTEMPLGFGSSYSRITALLINSGSVSPVADVKIGNIDLNATRSIGLEIGNGDNALTDVSIDGSNGVINVGNAAYGTLIGNAVGSDTDNLIDQL
ncbi:hypothetical protein [Sebaldella sp. S0638]|uniref:hypothetical protein n=1 Tax=Sebaldella sp. S0638 TaxID=2957809 RepID=UPI0020A0BC87|nr:hypothetical protein [Sebaldella sp. S0638]MCP1223464.1 hypothetical protein [Sebaldella sp. S0638]